VEAEPPSRPRGDRRNDVLGSRCYYPSLWQPFLAYSGRPNAMVSQLIMVCSRPTAGAATEMGGCPCAVPCQLAAAQRSSACRQRKGCGRHSYHDRHLIAGGAACWIRADPWLPDRPSTCGNCSRLRYHPDLRGNEPDSAARDGPPAAEVAGRSAFPLVSGPLLGGAPPVRVGLRVGLRVGRRGPDGHAVCPLFPVGSRRFPTRCWIRADPWAIVGAHILAVGRGLGRLSLPRHRRAGRGSRSPGSTSSEEPRLRVVARSARLSTCAVWSCSEGRASCHGPGAPLATAGGGRSTALGYQLA
jgi:hypothetical protein